MKADRSILAERESAPGWYARYRFYSRGRIPRGYEDWALSRLSLGRWIGIYLVIEAIWLGATAAVLGATIGFPLPLAGSGVALVAAALVPVSAVQSRNQAMRALAPPPAREVLRQIGEPVPPRY